jgi:hypothetical protein
MKLLPFLLLTNAIPPPQEAPKQQAPAAATFSNKNVIVIDPKVRANDYINAFDLLKKDKPTLKIMVRTTNQILSNVTEISTTPGGTLLIIKLVSSQGSKTQIVPVEEILDVSYSP